MVGDIAIPLYVRKQNVEKCGVDEEFQVRLFIIHEVINSFQGETPTFWYT